MQLSLHSKVTTIGKRNLQLKSQQLLYFPIQFLCSAASVLSVSLSPPQVSARFYIYHDFATITLAYSIHDATEEVTRKKRSNA
jgi:hypothetical protein